MKLMTHHYRARRHFPTGSSTAILVVVHDNFFDQAVNILYSIPIFITAHGLNAAAASICGPLTESNRHNTHGMMYI